VISSKSNSVRPLISALRCAKAATPAAAAGGWTTNGPDRSDLRENASVKDEETYIRDALAIARNSAPVECPSNVISVRTGTFIARSLAAPPRSGRSMMKQAATTSAPIWRSSLTAAFGRAAGGDQVIDQDHALAGLDGVGLCISISSSPYSSE
jgi:hypothetical protein